LLAEKKGTKKKNPSRSQGENFGATEIRRAGAAGELWGVGDK